MEYEVWSIATSRNNAVFFCDYHTSYPISHTIVGIGDHICP